MNRRLLRTRDAIDRSYGFYVGKLGMEVHTDVDLGFMGWVTVGVPGDRSREVLLEKVGRPYMDAYGIDFGARDPFGNSIRFSQPLAPVAG